MSLNTVSFILSKQVLQREQQIMSKIILPHPQCFHSIPLQNRQVQVLTVLNLSKKLILSYETAEEAKNLQKCNELASYLEEL